MDLKEELVTRHLSTPAFLHLPQVELSADATEQFLHQWAERGYLLVSVADDAGTHGDATFRQTRSTAAPMPAAAFWQRNGKFHNWLCDQDQEHFPLRFGADYSGPFALTWLIPAPAVGEIRATGFARPWLLDATIREQWLLDWARMIGRQLHPAQRMLLQLPGGQPAYWFYRTYRGDLPLEGNQHNRVVTLLASLPRYLSGNEGATGPSRPQEEVIGQLFMNDHPLTWGQGMVRCRDHFELSPFWKTSAYC